MKASRFNVFLASEGAKGIYNSFTGRFLMLPGREWDAVRMSRWQRLSDARRRSLADAGMLVPRVRDERCHFLDSVRRRRRSERWADVMFVSCPEPSQNGTERAALKRVESYIGKLARRRVIDVVKLRLLGWGQRPLEQRLQLLAALRDMKRNVTVPVFVMWVSNDLSEAVRLSAASADAFSFLFDPVRSTCTFDAMLQACRHIGRLASESRGVYIGIMASELLGVKQYLVKLRWAARSCMRCAGAAAPQWGLHCHAPGEGLYCRLDSCAGPGGLLNANRLDIACHIRDAGIPVNIALNPLNVHSNCPYTHPTARIFDWRGNGFHCLEDVDVTAGLRQDGAVPRPARSVPAEGSAILADPQCRLCSMLPVCSNGCPRKGRTGACPDYHCLLSRWFLGGRRNKCEDL
jgi:radical SAM protein with 4Fe4S-binding SPASM domain